MPSFTPSFKWASLAHGRTTLTALSAGSFILLGAFLRPPSAVSGMSPRAFWATKIIWAKQFDLVIGGDSRVAQGVSPSEIVQLWPGLRIGNFGFQGLGYTQAYLDALEKTLDPESGNRIIVLGISPSSLHPKASQRNDFTEASSEHPIQVWLERYVAPMIYPLRRVEPADIIRQLTDRTDDTIYHCYHSDGWIESYSRNPDPSCAINAYRKNGMNWSLVHAQDIIDVLLAQTRRWSERGIQVYVFRTPTTPEIVLLESQIFAFDEAQFAAALKEAGGQWIEVPSQSFETCDGSHLDRKSARVLSQYLATSIRRTARTIQHERTAQLVNYAHPIGDSSDATRDENSSESSGIGSAESGKD